MADVKIGTGQLKDVDNAQTDGTTTPTAFAFLVLIFAEPSTPKLELALDATEAMQLSMEPALLLLFSL